MLTFSTDLQPQMHTQTSQIAERKDDSSVHGVIRVVHAYW